MITCPKPDGQLPIANVGGKDQLKNILEPMGFEFLINTTKETDAVRLTLDPEGTGFVSLDNMVEYLSK